MHPDPQVRGQPGACPARQRQADMFQRGQQRDCAAAIASRQTLDPLGERCRRTIGVHAEEPPHRQHDHHRATAERTVGQTPDVATVHPGRTSPTPPTYRVHGTRPSRDRHAAGLTLDPFDTQTSQMPQRGSAPD
jgi:hypothetical protein